MTTDMAIDTQSRGRQSPSTQFRRVGQQRDFWLVKFFGGFFRHDRPAAESLDPERLSDYQLRDLGFDPRAAREDWPPTAWRPGTVQRLGQSPLPPI
jgi:hypothetical protein